jgi:RHH-type rel operon transcriptional repressor/antitoxin RelB
MSCAITGVKESAASTAAPASVAIFIASPIEPLPIGLLPGHDGVKAGRWDTTAFGCARAIRLVYTSTMSKQTAVRLPDETYERLQTLAARTGRTATFYIRAAVEEKLQDMEDLYLAEEVMRRRADGGSRTYSLDEVGRELGVDD